jgi:hypothetical protein
MNKKDIKPKVKPKTTTNKSNLKADKNIIKKKVSVKSATNKKTSKKNIKQNIKDKTSIIKNKINLRTLLFIIFFTAVLLVFSSYAWLSSSLNVQVKFFDLVVSSDRGLFISLDGIDFTESVEISLDSIITNLKATYPNHTNQWSASGLWPVSSPGIRNANSDKFDIFVGDVVKYKDAARKNIKYLKTKLVTENNSEAANIYMAFDIFLKNVSGSPKSDNLYFADDTFVDFVEGTPDDVKEDMSGIMNSMRFGIVKVGTVPSKSDVNSIQNMVCNNNCQMVIYEPNSTRHSAFSIERTAPLGINLVDGVHYQTYASISEGTYLQYTSGQPGTGIPLDTEHFALQKAITDFENPIFQIPNGITKCRVYVWIEGQDVDSLETNSKGASIALAINFEKDLAGYQ